MPGSEKSSRTRRSSTEGSTTAQTFFRRSGDAHAAFPQDAAQHLLERVPIERVVVDDECGTGHWA